MSPFKRKKKDFFWHISLCLLIYLIIFNLSTENDKKSEKQKFFHILKLLFFFFNHRWPFSLNDSTVSPISISNKFTVQYKNTSDLLYPAIAVTLESLVQNKCWKKCLTNSNNRSNDWHKWSISGGSAKFFELLIDQIIMIVKEV